MPAHRDAREMKIATVDELRLERLRLLAVVLPLAYVVAIVGFLAFEPFPSWASSLVAIAVSLPLVVAFTAVVFNVVSTMRSELVQREQRFANLVESAPDGIVIANDDGVIVMVNEQTDRMFGYRREELVGRSVEALIPAGLRERHVRHRAGYQSRPELRPMGAGLDLVGLRKDGTEFPVEISLSPIAQEGGLLVNAVIRDISQRRALEEERERLLTEAETQRERERIAMDLHDGVIQSIYAVALGLEGSMEDIEHESPATLRERIDRSINQLDEVMRDIRSYIFHLRPPRIDDDLSQSLKILVDNFRVNSLIEVSITVSAELPSIEQARSLAAFHIVQEALNNVRKHARATSVQLSLLGDNGHLRLEVRDNGVGFDGGAAASEAHRGLKNMAARAKAADATLTVESEHGKGTMVRLDLPSEHREG
jgi:PAS domain S-box-containing protein